jgi:alkyl sulfatase BDS1-like metallo-beta-lactamase superfamily hydrolase
LDAHTSDFSQAEFVQVSSTGDVPQVYAAIGFGLSNSIIVVGQTGYTIIDTNESVNVSSLVRAAVYATFGVKPTVAIVYTHSHADHFSGTSAWLAPFPPYLPAANPPIYAHASWQSNEIIDLLITPATVERSYWQFGNYLSPGPNGFINSGIGPFLMYNINMTRTYVQPTITFQTSLATEIDGYNVTLIYAPGENGDMINIVLTDVNIVVTGDNVIDSFPDIYAPRGVRSRPARDWFNSVDMIRDLQPNALALTHTQPIIGATLVQQKLQVYRDIIQYTHDRTLAYLSVGVPVQFIARNLTLPAALQNPQQFYGTLSSSVLAIADYYVGWWNGQITTIEPLDPFTQSVYFVEALDGPDFALLKAEGLIASRSLDAQRFALQILEAILTIPVANSLSPGSVPSNLIPSASVLSQTTKDAIQVMTNLGISQISANTRNIYLSAANKLAGYPEFGVSLTSTAAALLQNPISLLFEFLPIKLNTTILATLTAPFVPEFPVLIELADAGVWTIRIRQASVVAEIRQPTIVTPPFLLTIQTNSLVFKSMIIQPASIPQLLQSGALRLSTPLPISPILVLEQLLALFS